MRFFISLLLLTGSLSAQQQLVPFDSLSAPQIDESSGLIASRLYPGVFWTHNDSGDAARIFAIDSTGEMLKPEWAEDYDGLSVAGAQNIDWEDIAIDDMGNLIIGAFGNNGSARRDLAVYVLPEPNPLAVTQSRVLRRIDFSWPDQTTWPDSSMNHDCEACFFGAGHLWFLSKHRSDQNTCLYRLDPPRVVDGAWYTAFDPGVIHPLTKLGCLQVTHEEGIPGMVTAADLSPDGRRLAVLSYTSIVLCEADPGNWFEGDIQRMSIRAGQCESLCWWGEALLLGNEQRMLYRVNPGEFDNN